MLDVHICLGKPAVISNDRVCRRPRSRQRECAPNTLMCEPLVTAKSVSQGRMSQICRDIKIRGITETDAPVSTKKQNPLFISNKSTFIG